MYHTWKDMKYSKEEFHKLYENANGFNEILSDHQFRSKSTTFEQFMDEGSKLLISSYK